MAFVLGDRTRETSTAPGTGSFTVNGAVQGAQSLASVLTANGDTTWYAATNGTAWEAGLLTRTSATVYARTTIFASSNAGAAVNFSSGLVDVFIDLPASRWATKADLASPSFTGLVTLVGGQLVFPATQSPSADANTFDDYEEGTWTPVLTFATPGNLSVSYSAQSGSYIKTGKSVTITFNIQTSSFTHTTASGDLTFTGVPFTCQNVSSDRWRGMLQFQGITKANYTSFACGPIANTTTMLFIASGSGQGIATVTAADVPTGGTVTLQGSVTYMAAN